MAKKEEVKNGKILKQKIKIWVDDLRPVPSGYEGTKSVDETIALIEEIEKAGGKGNLLSNRNSYCKSSWQSQYGECD